MDAVTYPQEEVISFVMAYLIPLRIDVSDESAYENFHAFWTPTLAIIDTHGHEIQRVIGFYQPVELLATLCLGIAKARLSDGDHDTAEVQLSRLLDQFPESGMIPEAIFFRGVNRYKMKNDPVQLKQAYEKLTADYPDSPWTKRAAPYRLI